MRMAAMRHPSSLGVGLLLLALLQVVGRPADVAAQAHHEHSWPKRAKPTAPSAADVKGWVADLASQDPETRAKAAKRLTVAVPAQYTLVGAEEVPILLSALQSDDLTLRRAAAAAFSNLTHHPDGAQASRPAVGALCAALSDRDSAVAMQAATALGHIRDQAAREPLIAALGDEREGVVAAAGSALGHLVEVEPSGAASLVKALRYERAQGLVANLLSGLQARAPIAELAAALHRDDVQMRRGAAMSLRGIREPAAIAALKTALRDPDPQVRTLAATGLGWSEDRKVAAELLPLLKDQDAGVRGAAAEALRLGGSEAVEPLLALLKDPDPTVRQQAASSLMKIGDDRAVQPLVALLADPALGDTLFHTLGHWTGNKTVVKALIGAMGDSDAAVRARAAKTLSVDNLKVGMLGKEAVAPLLAFLKHPQVEVRQAAAFSLQTLGSGRFLDDGAVGPLTEAAQHDENPMVRRYAEMALSRVGKKP